MVRKTQTIHLHTKRLVWFGWVSVAAHAVVEFVVPAMILNSAFWSMQMPSKKRSRIDLGTPKNHKSASSNQYCPSCTLLGHRQVLAPSSIPLLCTFAPSV